MPTITLSLNDAQTPVSEIDQLLTAQIVIAWAGEAGEVKRMGWWRSDLISEFGGEDLLKRMLPNTWRWAMFQSVREVARRIDLNMRGKDHDSDTVISLYRLGFKIDERVDDRLAELKRNGSDPEVALDLTPVTSTSDYERIHPGQSPERIF